MSTCFVQKTSPDMKISDPSAVMLCDEFVILKDLLPLSAAHIIELGCGKAEKTRMLARDGQVASILALEVDAIQHEKNLHIRDLPKSALVSAVLRPSLPRTQVATSSSCLSRCTMYLWTRWIRPWWN